LRSLAKDRDDRFENATQLVTAFKEAWSEAGVPMQGTFIRVSQALKPVEKSAESPLPVAATVDATSAVREISKRRSPWMWVGVGLVILLCLGMVWFVRSNRVIGRLLANSRTQATETRAAPMPAPSATQPAPAALLPPQQPLATKVGGVIVPPEILDVQKRANDHPNDLNAQLDLALMYWNAKWQKETYDTLGNLIKLAGMDNRDFFVQAGDKFKGQNEGWLPAAILYFQAVRSYTLSGDVPDQLVESFHESLYKGVNRPEAAMLVPFDRVADVDKPIALIAKSCNAFFSGRIDEAHTLLDQVKRIESTMREAALLEGEFSALDGQKEQARLVLNPLVEDVSSTPEWIRLFAHQILDGIK